MIIDYFSVQQQARAAEARARRNRERAIREMQKMRTAPPAYSDLMGRPVPVNEFAYRNEDTLFGMRLSIWRAMLAWPGVVDVVFIRGEMLPVFNRPTPIPEVRKRGAD